MAESGFVTGQYVRIQPSVASVGDRMIAQIIDWVLLVAYIMMMGWLIDTLKIMNEWISIILLLFVPLFYTLVMEILNHGQTVGKMVMKMQVTKQDGTSPTIGTYVMRWLLYLVDGPATSFMGVVCMMVTHNNQRLGDLAAGTVVIKQQNYRKIQISLDEYEYLSKNYIPNYPQAADLSLEQIDIITRTLRTSSAELTTKMQALAQKVQEKLNITRKEKDDAAFLKRIVRDYQYYAIEEI